ncbi:MAG: HAD family hydrolase [Proteobacteria bacterium]|nr:HAD family hydrolase [Pseudomonadota bacterium]NDC25672.1 HAD family hydrolase [Pseudomonadota bacterium]NDD05462.1 HAD family hydrolase [Pseudomonadota bacterium]NDG27849.1 HAD family hydrolase [Pseudomonadota bacterium]
MSQPGKPAIFLDRDGTIIEDLNYPRDPEKVVLIPGAIEGLKEMAQKGYLLFVISNQSGVGRGLITDKEFVAVHERVSEILKSQGIEIKEFGYCFHKPEDLCQCRKPGNFFIKQFSQIHLVQLSQSYSIGDKWCDVELGVKVGAQGALVLTGKGTTSLQENRIFEKSGLVFKDLWSFARFLPNKN